MDYKRFFRKKDIKTLLLEASKQQFNRTLNAFQLIMLGIGAIVGAGIFVFAGSAASTSAGPAVVLSFIVGACACACAALCYAELASTIPLSGGAYSYAYVTFGELAAWLIGSLILVGNIFMLSAVVVGWSGYVIAFLEQFGITIPLSLTYHTGQIATMPDGTSITGIFNILSIVITSLVCMILYKGVATSAVVNNVIVIIKIVVLTSFIVIGAMYINVENWFPFIPEHIEETGQFGIQGVFGGAAIVFLAFNGFDTVASAAQETKNPQRDLPIGVIGSLLVSAVIYILVSGVLTGLVNYKELNVPQPMALAVKAMNMPWFAVVINIGAICGLASVTLVMTYAVVRIAFTMASDNLLPGFLKTLHPKNKTPYIGTILVTSIICLLAGTCSLDAMVNIGNFCVIVVFIIVCVMAMYLRYTQPELKREFVCPMMPFIPLIGIGLFVLFLVNMPDKTAVVYFLGLIVISTMYYLVRVAITSEKKM